MYLDRSGTQIKLPKLFRYECRLLRTCLVQAVEQAIDLVVVSLRDEHHERSVCLAMDDHAVLSGGEASELDCTLALRRQLFAGVRVRGLCIGMNDGANLQGVLLRHPAECLQGAGAIADCVRHSRRVSDRAPLLLPRTRAVLSSPVLQVRSRQCPRWLAVSA